ncbi:hypothetical protein SPI_02933 [Niveomyces insectorum RCEF 264]|uniref:Uncharacterized protein n=1 Tax=Niveomyces insectorum RCEF 264 TaxID=1081102 RepID=A0A167WX98_9HYPO|nr:hypothetical protein SPI_02933 [Niveomyces insectorum RCEF 264]
MIREQLGSGAILHDQASGDGNYSIPHLTSQVPPGKKVCAVIALMRSAYGAVRVAGDLNLPYENVVTGLDADDEQYLIILEGEQRCHILGSSAYRLVTR